MTVKTVIAVMLTSLRIVRIERFLYVKTPAKGPPNQFFLPLVSMTFFLSFSPLPTQPKRQCLHTKEHKPQTKGRETDRQTPRCNSTLRSTREPRGVPSGPHFISILQPKPNQTVDSRPEFHLSFPKDKIKLSCGAINHSTPLRLQELQY